MRRWVLALIASGTLVAVTGAMPAHGLDQSDKPLVVSFEQRVAQQDYPPMTASNPVAHDSEGFLFSPERCRQVTWCDTIPLSISAPEATPYRLIITTTFVHAGGGNDIDVYLFEEQVTFTKNEDGSETRESETAEIGSSASGDQPEIMKLADMPSSTETLLYWVVPLNWTGTTPYTIKAEVIPEDLPDISEFDYTPPSGQARTSSFESSRGGIPLSSLKSSTGTGGKKAEPGLDPVKVPGADGELTEHELLAIKGQATEEQRSRAPLVAAVVAVLALGAGTFLWFFIRSRRRGEEAA